MSSPPRFRIELTRKEGWALLEYVRQSGGLDEYASADAIESILEKIRVRMGINKEKYGER